MRIPIASFQALGLTSTATTTHNYPHSHALTALPQTTEVTCTERNTNSALGHSHGDVSLGAHPTVQYHYSGQHPSSHHDNLNGGLSAKELTALVDKATGTGGPSISVDTSVNHDIPMHNLDSEIQKEQARKSKLHNLLERLPKKVSKAEASQLSKELLSVLAVDLSKDRLMHLPIYQKYLKVVESKLAPIALEEISHIEQSNKVMLEFLHIYHPEHEDVSKAVKIIEETLQSHATQSGREKMAIETTVMEIMFVDTLRQVASGHNLKAKEECIEFVTDIFCTIGVGFILMSSLAGGRSIMSNHTDDKKKYTRDKRRQRLEKLYSNLQKRSVFMRFDGARWSECARLDIKDHQAVGEGQLVAIASDDGRHEDMKRLRQAGLALSKYRGAEDEHLFKPNFQKLADMIESQKKIGLKLRLQCWQFLYVLLAPFYAAFDNDSMIRADYRAIERCSDGTVTIVEEIYEKMKALAEVAEKSRHAK